MKEDAKIDSGAQFYSNLNIAGNGRAYFSNPVGYAVGTATVSVLSNGEIKVVMEAIYAQNDNSDDKLNILGFLGFFENSRMSRYGQGGNECKYVTVENEILRFTSIGNNLLYNPEFHINQDSNKATITFFITIGKFEKVDRSIQAVKHILAPVYNYTSPYHEDASVIAGHPLLRWNEPLLKIETFDGNNKTTQTLNQKITRFHANGKNCFIQPFGNVEVQTDSLRRNEYYGAITALLALDIDITDISWEGVRKIFPFDIFLLLSLAAGKFVGSSILFLTNDKAEMICAFFVKINMQRFSNCYCPFNFATNNHCTILINGALKNRDELPFNIRVAINTLLKVKIPNITIEDQIFFTCRCIEALWKDLRPQREPYAGIPIEIRNIIESGIADIVENTKQYRDDPTRVFIKKLSNVPYKNVTFSDYIKIMLKKYSFPDEEILKETEWLMDINEMRNKSIHGGSPISDDEDFPKLLRSLHHLQDIATRIILKYLDYSGTYGPPCFRVIGAVEVDRLKIDSSPNLLGYGYPLI